VNFLIEAIAECPHGALRDIFDPMQSTFLRSSRRSRIERLNMHYLIHRRG